VRQAKCVSFLNQSDDKYTIIFADPPYNEKQEIDTLIESISTGDYLLPNGLFILEHKSMAQVAHPAIVETREYGQSTFSFFNFEGSNE
jgi:16S rRNA G966 N2-methylase RsmD